MYFIVVLNFGMCIDSIIKKAVARGPAAGRGQQR